ncbi:uncharacterized protein LOC110067417 isoform X3 [Orbicella faveolata]|uniref:uncharacterized protein LOC110067417 isoform X3 n=1 Tax=Orbicella faveolata TaxID=48498 RepID=UPI0009E1E243|nr:uncharacterized protein LOC110067417 isoform X3 [Orbicella faveolata]
MQEFEGDSHEPNFADAQHKIDTSLLKVAAAEQRNSQPDNDIGRHPKNSPAGEITWQGERQIDEEVYNENTHHCANCHLLQSEYGRVLFERDLAQRNLRLASYRFEDDLQRQRDRENNGAAAAFQEDKMEHSHDKPDQSSPRMSWRYSELPSAKVPSRLKGDLKSSISALKDHGARNTNTEGTRTFLNGYANYLSDSEDSVHSSLDGGKDGDDNDANDRVHDSDENDNDDDNNADKDGDNQEIECNDDDKCDNGDDSLDDDDDDHGDDSDSDNDGDDDSDDNDNDDDEYDKNGDIGQDASYSCPEGNISVVSDRVNESLTQESSFSFHISSSNEEKINSNENIYCRPGSSSNDKISGEKVYDKNEDSSRSSEGDDNAKLLAAGGTTPYAHKKKSPIVSIASNVTSQGARPKTSSQTPVLSNVVDPDLHDGKIPSLDVTGISQGFLARHTTDQSLPYSSNTGDNDLPTSESTSSTDWPHTSITSNGNSSTSWSLPGPSFPNRSEPLQDRAYPRGLNPRYGDPRNMGYQPVAPMTGLGTGWQLSNQQKPQSGRTSSNFPLEDQRISNRAESWLTSHDESPSHPNVLGHFIGATGTQGDDSLNRQTWMPGNYETSWRWPRYDYNRYQTDPSTIGDLALRNEPAVNSPAVNAPAPAVTLPSVTLPNASLNFQTAASEPLTSQSSSSTMPGSHNLHLSQATTSTEDNSLVALERKVAEACAIVERVLKEREERTKRQREEVQRQREIRERRQREARERRERQEREMRERAEREAREREDMAVAERAPVQESPLWQCEHYQRRCSVRFPCCGVFYPCHRCHNGSGACDADDKKANQATHVKCASCGHEEEINEGSQTCSSCGARLSEYFCFKCKHFTGVDKNPFHCDKCGICRIYKDRSFHCDVCNVCLDKRLEGKHKCRPDSGHDECCICLEDAFSGCQILPCSHKVHRECAIAMIQNGVRNCPICRHPLYSQGSQ